VADDLFGGTQDAQITRSATEAAGLYQSQQAPSREADLVPEAVAGLTRAISTGEGLSAPAKRPAEASLSPYTGLNKATGKDDTFRLQPISPCLGYAAFLKPDRVEGAFKITA